jgi:hypothetical protein
MSIPRSHSLAAALLSSLCLQVQAIELPSIPTDTRVAAAFAQARAVYSRAESPGYMDMPTDAKPWPCAVTELQLRRWIGYMALNDADLDDKARKANAAAFRASGMSADELKSTVRDVRQAPLVASCKDGKLDGPLEFVLEYTRVLDMPVAIMETRTRTRITLQIAAGEQVMNAAVSVNSLQLSSKSTYKDPAVEAMMQKTKTPQVTMRMAVASLPLNDEEGYSAVITETRAGSGPAEWMTVMSQPTGPKRMETRTYRGSALWTIARIKNQRMHGEQKSFPTTFSGVPVPGGSQCFEDGELIKTTRCDVE